MQTQQCGSHIGRQFAAICQGILCHTFMDLFEMHGSTALLILTELSRHLRSMEWQAQLCNGATTDIIPKK